MAIVSFRNQGTEDVFDGKNTPRARRVCPTNLMRIARRKLDQLANVTRLESLRVPPGNQLEALKDDRRGQHSIRINDRYRVCFAWRSGNAHDVEIVDYH